MSIAQSGDTVKLLPGGYSKQGSGDIYPQTVSAGVTIVGTLASNGAKQTFLSPESSTAGTTGLIFAGDATVKDLELDVFGTALQATKANVTLTHLNLIQNGFALDLRGSVKATLNGAEMFLADQNDGVRIADQARLTMDGGTIKSASACATIQFGISLHDSAQATLKNNALIENIHGDALSLNNAAKATLNGSTIRQTSKPNCGNGINIVSVAGASSATTLAMTNSHVSGYSGTGIRITGNDTVTLTGGSISSNGIGIEQIFDTVHPIMTMTGVSVTNNKTGLHLDEPVFKLRKSILSHNEIGITVRGNVGFIGGGPAIDLGSDPSIDKSLPPDPGDNDFSGNTTSAISFVGSKNIFSVSGVWAVGNTWNPNVQDSDSNGHYLRRAFITSASSLATGKNFVLISDRKSLSL